MTTDDLRQECWTRAIKAFGTATIFEQRAQAYSWRIRIPAFLGIAVPVVVGGYVASFSATAGNLPKVLWLTGVLGLIQLVLSVCARCALGHQPRIRL